MSFDNYFKKMFYNKQTYNNKVLLKEFLIPQDIKNQ